jgi:hypothetical protein
MTQKTHGEIEEEIQHEYVYGSRCVALGGGGDSDQRRGYLICRVRSES